MQQNAPQLASPCLLIDMQDDCAHMNSAVVSLVLQWRINATIPSGCSLDLVGDNSTWTLDDRR